MRILKNRIQQNYLMIQTDSVINPQLLFEDYRYLSSIGLSKHFNEVADIFVVNKSDRPGAKKVEFYVKSMLEDNLRKVERKHPVIKASYKDKESVKKI